MHPTDCLKARLKYPTDSPQAPARSLTLMSPERFSRSSCLARVSCQGARPPRTNCRSTRSAARVELRSTFVSTRATANSPSACQSRLLRDVVRCSTGRGPLNGASGRYNLRVRGRLQDGRSRIETTVRRMFHAPRAILAKESSRLVGFVKDALMKGRQDGVVSFMQVSARAPSIRPRAFLP